MIKDGFIYISTLFFIAAILINLPKIVKGKAAQKFFSFAPPIVLIYLGLMVLCTAKLWDLESTAEAYSNLKNPLLYAMLFIMLLRCDLKKIIKLGPKMLIGFFAASISIGLSRRRRLEIFRCTLRQLDGWWWKHAGNPGCSSRRRVCHGIRSGYGFTLCYDLRYVPSVGDRIF